MVEVFKTSIAGTKKAEKVLTQLLHNMPSAKINVDLEDCDRILRIEAADIETHVVIQILHGLELHCEVL